MSWRGGHYRKLRDFFAEGGTIGIPEDLRPIRLSYGGGPAGGKTAEIEKWLERVSEVVGGVPVTLGVDIAHGRSESWLVTWDAEAGKMVYRKLDPADMVRRDLAGEGSPDNGSD